MLQVAAAHCRHTAKHHTKSVHFTHLFNCTSHVSKYRTNLLKIIDFLFFFTDLAAHQFLTYRVKWNSWALQYHCSAQKHLHLRHASHTVSGSFNYSDMISYWRTQALVVCAASEVTNHHATPHPWCSAARPCRTQRGTSSRCLLQMCMII